MSFNQEEENYLQDNIEFDEFEDMEVDPAFFYGEIGFKLGFGRRYPYYPPNYYPYYPYHRICRRCYYRYY